MKRSSLVVAVSLVGGLAWCLGAGAAMAQVEPAGGGTTGVDTGSTLIQTDTDEDQPAARQRFTVRLSGGASFPSIGSLNSAMEALDAPMRATRHDLSGEIDPFGRGMDLAVDAVVNVTPRLGIVLGSGLITGLEAGGNVTARRTPNTLPVSCSGDLYCPTPITETSALGEDHQLRTIPLRLGIQYSAPIARALTARARVGVGYYFVRWEARSTYEWEADYSIPYYDFSFAVRDTSEATLTGNALGFFGGAALDYRVTKNISLFVEGTYRRARVEPLEGDLVSEVWSQLTDWQGPQAPTIESYEGPATAYSFEYQVSGPSESPWRPAVEIDKEAPEEEPTPDFGRGVRGVEELMLDLSGASLSFGVSVSF